MGNKNLKKQSAFKRFFAGNSYCWLAVGCTVGIMMLVYFCYDLFPFGDTTILRMDLYHQYGPLFAEFYDRVTNLKSFVYSWNTGLGSPFLGNFFNYLSSPSAIIILLLGHENMPEAIAGMILVKAALAAGAFTYYLKKSQGKHNFSTTAFGILYAMCGYFVAYYWNVMWIDAMVYFPLVIYGIERIIHRRKPSVYIIFLALTLITNYYMGYMTCIFSVIYFFVFYFSHYDFGSLADNAVYFFDEKGKKQYRFIEKVKGSVLLRSGSTFAIASLAAGALVAVSLIPTAIILRSCSATSGTWPENYKIYFSIFDFLANHLASVEPTIRSSGEDVLPNIYCGIGTVMLVPLFIFAKSVPIKEKIASVFTLGFMFFSFNLNYLNYIWHGFHFPNDLPYRFSFMYVFLLLVLAYKAYLRLDEFTGRQILGVGVAVVFAIIMIQEIGSKNVQDISILLSIVFVTTYCLIFYVLKDVSRQKTTLSVVLLCCVIAEVACANTDRYSMTQIKGTFTDDYAAFREVKNYLDEKEDGDKSYRMELTYNRARMDPAWFGYNGVSTFSSMAYEKMSNMQSNLGLYSNYINSYTYYVQTPVYNMMNSIKYVVNNDPKVSIDDDFFTELTVVDKYTAYRNDYHLPIAMAVNRDINDWYSGYTNPFLVQAEWLECATGVKDVFEMMNISDVRYYNVEEINAGLETGDMYFTKRSFGSTGEITFVLTVPETQHCYLFVDSSTFEEITIMKADDSVVQETDEPYIYDLGIIHPDETVEVLLTIEDFDYGNINFYPYYIVEEKLDKGYEILKENQFNVKSFEETKITGDISVDKNMVMFTSIPYDEGWTVKIDGKEIDSEDYIYLEEAYLAFNLPKGEHEIEISFTQRGLAPGAMISGATLLLLIIAAIIIKLTSKKREDAYNTKCEKALNAYEEAMRLKEQAEKAAEEVSGEYVPIEFAEWTDIFSEDNQNSETQEIIEETEKELDSDIEEIEKQVISAEDSEEEAEPEEDAEVLEPEEEETEE